MPIAAAKKSTADRPFHLNPLWRAYDAVADRVDHKIGWPRLPKHLGLADLVGVRNALREENLHDTSRQPAVNGVEAPEWDERFATERTVDGAGTTWTTRRWGWPAPGSAATCPSSRPGPTREPARAQPAHGEPPADDPRRAHPRDRGNALIASWLQFMIRDWFRHGPARPKTPGRSRSIPTTTGPPRCSCTGHHGPDHAARQHDHPPTYINVMTHWWDGSQIYGNSAPEQAFLRPTRAAGCGWSTAPAVPDDPKRNPTQVPGFWLGIGMLQTLFAQEHNSVCEMLARPPRLGRRAPLPARPGDHLRTAGEDPHHRVDAGRDRAPHRGRGPARQLVRPRRPEARPHRPDRENEVLTGIPGTETDHYGVPFALTEEFVAVYRMHPLIPDTSTSARRPTTAPRSARASSTRSPARRRGHAARPDLADLLYTFGTMNPGLVCLHNFPAPADVHPPRRQLMDLAATDILRSRELGVPRYTEFRRLLHLTVPRPSTTSPPTSSGRASSGRSTAAISTVDLIPGCTPRTVPRASRSATPRSASSS